MKAFVFPGQGAQYIGMGQKLYEQYDLAKKMFKQANNILGFSITDVMFGSDEQALKQTKVTQPAVFLHSVILSKVLGNAFNPQVVAGHSLGEFSALVAANYLSFEDGLKLVSKRAIAMQKACEKEPSTMAAVLGLDPKSIQEVCNTIEEVVVPANYNAPGQIVISGSLEGIKKASEKLLIKGAKRVIQLAVGGAFHSPLMLPAKEELEEAIDQTMFKHGICPIYQNVEPIAIEKPDQIKKNLKNQLTSSVQWTQTMENMIKNGVTSATEVGPGNVLQGLFKKIDRKFNTDSASLK